MAAPTVRVSAGGVVFEPEGKVLVVSQQFGSSWSLPKGGIEENENTLEAAKREIAEESGVMDLEYVKELGSYERYKISKDGGEDRSQLKKIYMFLFRTKQNELKPTDPANTEARWLDTDDVEKQLTHQKDKEFFRSVKSQLYL